MGRRPNRSNRLNHPSSTEVAQPIPSLPLPRCHPHFVGYSPRTLLLSVASLVSPLEHSGAAVHPHRQRTELGWLLLESRDPQLGSPSPTATWRPPARVRPGAEERLDLISRVASQASTRERVWRDRQHPLSSILPWGQEEVLIVEKKSSEGAGHVRGGGECGRTSNFESARVAVTLVVDVPVILGDHGDNWDASLNCEVEGALLEGPYVVIRTRGTRSFGENPYRGVSPF